MAFLVFSFSVSAECWVVGDMHGISYSERNNFQPEEDGFSGTFIIKTNGEDASITYSGSHPVNLRPKQVAKFTWRHDSLRLRFLNQKSTNEILNQPWL